MHRRSLIKCILGLAAAPKVLAEMEFKPPIVPQPLLTKSLIKDMQLLTPQFYNTYIEKYGNVDYVGLMAESFGNSYDKAALSWYETNKPKTDGNETKSS